MRKLAVLSILALILFIGSFLRLYRLTEVPQGFMQDEAAAGYDAYSLIKTGKDHHGANWPITFQTFNDWTGHSFNYQLLPFVKIFGLNTFSIRFAVSFFSIISIILVYLLGKELVRNEFVSLLMALLFSLSQFSVASSRWAIQPNTVVFFVTVSLYFFLSGLNRVKRRRFLWSISGILFGLSLYSYPSVEGFLPIWLLGAILILFFNREKYGGKRLLVDLTFLVILSVTISLPLVLDHIKRPETLTIKLSMISVSSLSNNPAISYLKNYVSYFLPNYLFLPGDINPVRAIPGFGYENMLLGFFYYLGLILLIFKRRALSRVYPLLDKTKVYLIYLYFFAFPIVPSLTLPEGNFQRAIYIIPLMIFVISLSLVFSFEKVKNTFYYSEYNYTFLIAFAVVSIYIYKQYSFYKFYFGPEYSAYAQWYFQYSLDKVIKFTGENEGKYKNITIDNTINMPYIYVLFYKQVDPKTLDYEDFDEVDPKTKWLSVTKYKSYLFKKVTLQDVTGGRLIKIIYNSPFSNYVIYEKGGDLIVRFETKSGHSD